jgi:two-component system cell cycle sensor histidine kinase/response regulator CckA
VLVVDDEPSVLRMVSVALSGRGYEVHAVAHPHEALKLVRERPCFDLVVSDVIMPDMCGPELLRRVREICPNAAVVVMSAHVADEELPAHAKFIGKPFAIADLYCMVEKALARNEPLG